MICVCGFLYVSNDYPANIIYFDLIFRIILGNCAYIFLLDVSVCLVCSLPFSASA